MIQQFTFIGVPKAQGRPRFARRGKFVTAYDPKDSAQYKNNVAAQIVAQKPVLIGQGIAIKLTLGFILPRPQGHYGAKGNVKEKYKSMRHVKKPDSDNLVKAIKDSLTGIVWYDDSQIDYTIVQKSYGDEPKAFITVETEV
jgi:Holliday junction resolvase RusA-like endonuclease